MLWDIWSTVENYFQKILSSPPWRNAPSILLPFLATLYIFQAPPAERGPPFGGGGHFAFFSKNGLVLPNFGWIK